MNHSETNGHKSPPLIFVFDNMRARSHLFFKWMSTHPDLAPIYHPFIRAAWLGKTDRYTKLCKCSEARQKENDEGMMPVYGDDTYESCRGKMDQNVKSAEEKSKISFANEHWFNVMKHSVLFDFMRRDSYKASEFPSNPTEITDSTFASIIPIIFIRHPVLKQPSLHRSMLAMTACRPGDEDYEITSTLGFCRLLFDFFKAQGKQPIVVDGEDVVWRNEELAESLGEKLRLDPKGFSDKWAPEVHADWLPEDPLISNWIIEIERSGGIQRPGKKPNLELDRAYERWIEEFGKQDADALKRRVDADTPHYQYLIQFKA